MRKMVWVSLMCSSSVFFPLLSHAQVADDIHSLHTVLDNLYEDMLPLCEQFITVSRGIAGFGALFFIAYRVWGHLAKSEPIDFYPLLRPFVLGFCILSFPAVLALINGVMKPTVTATNSMVENSNAAIASLLQAKEKALQQTDAWKMFVGPSGEGDRERWYRYEYGEDPSAEGWLEKLPNAVSFQMSKMYYNLKNSIKVWLSEVLRVVYETAALAINTLRTFQLIVLAILGPLVFAISVYDGFQHTLNVWIARYLNIFLWLPVANIFGSILGKIQENMLQLDISQVNANGSTFFSSTDMAYLVFLLIGIVGYCTVPSVANYIVHAGGGNALLSKVTGGSMAMARDVYGNARSMMSSGHVSAGGNYFK
jgi:conjugative transposon TraJ protein